MKKNIYISIFFTIIFVDSLAQKIRFCANECRDSVAKTTDAQYLIKKMKYEQALEIQMNFQKNFRVAAEVIRIPVVVHVIHNQINGQIAGTNISDEQIYSQIKVLNEDYRNKNINKNPLAVDTEIEFFLATTDPDGKPSSGIRRVYSSKSSFDILNDSERLAMSNLSYWDSNKYLNIWVASFSSGFIGFGEFPYSESVEGLGIDSGLDERTDGVFADYTVFGRKSGTNQSGIYSFGRTVTHEVGHWMGLYHIWGDERCGTDYVADTPPAIGPNNSKFCRVLTSNCNGVRTTNMIENYMDYSPDSCMNIFTEGQKQRMRAALELSKRRKRVLNYSKFQLPASTALQVNFENPMPLSNLQFQVLLPSFQDFNLVIRDIFGREIYNQSFIDLPSTVVTLPRGSITPGVYILSLTSNQQIIQKKLVFY